MVFTELLVKIFIFILGSAVGIYFIKNHEQMVRMIGKNEWAEKVTSAGSYPMWIIIGVVVIVISFLFLIGQLDFLFFR